jgi:hypothetical protein
LQPAPTAARYRMPRAGLQPAPTAARYRMLRAAKRRPNLRCRGRLQTGPVRGAGA